MHKAAFPTYPSVQCAAVITHSSLRREPPHQIVMDLRPLGSLLVRPTCQPISPFIAFSPPTIRWILSSAESSRFVTPSLFWPQTAIHFVNLIDFEKVCPISQLTAIRIGPVQEGERGESFQNQHACLSSDALIWTERSIRLNIAPQSPLALRNIRSTSACIVISDIIKNNAPTDIWILWSTYSFYSICTVPRWQVISTSSVNEPCRFYIVRLNG